MQVLGSLLLALLCLAGAGSFARHVSRNVTPQPARQRASARVRQAARTAKGKLPPSVQQQIDRAVRSEVAARTRRYAREAGPAVRRTARRARPAGKRTQTGAPFIPFTEDHPRPAAKHSQPKPARPAPPQPKPVMPVPPEPARKDPPVTSSPATPGTSGADLFAALRVMVTHAETGNLQAKQRVLLQLGEVFEYTSDVVAGLARRMAEPDQNYQPAVWEPVVTAAAHARAAHVSVGEASSALSHLVHLTLGEAVSTGQRIPHHEQINSGT